MNIQQRLAELEAMGSSVERATGRFRGMFYGPIGSGKTTLSAGIASLINSRGSKTLFIDTSEGWESLKRFPALAATGKQIPFTTIDDLTVIAQGIAANQGFFEDIGTVVIDEASTIAQWTVDSLWDKRYKETMRTGSQQQKEKLEPNPQWPDYHAALIQIRGAFNAFYRIPGLHVILLAHRTEIKNDKGLIVGYRPAFSEKMANALKKDMHLVGYVTAAESRVPGTEQINYTRTVQVQPTAGIDAKNRIKGFDLVRYEVDPVVGILSEWMRSGAELVSDTNVTTPNELAQVEAAQEVESAQEISEVTLPAIPSFLEPVDPVELI